MRLFERSSFWCSPEKLYLISGILIIIAYCSPFLIYREKAYYPPGSDRLSEVPKFLFNSIKDILAPYDANIQHFGAIKRFCLPSEFNILVWLFYFLGVIPTITIVSICGAIIGYIGTWLLLEHYIYPFLQRKFQIFPGERQLNFSIFVVSLYSGLVYQWWFGTLAVNSGPLITYAILNIYYKRSSIKDWVVIVLTPLFIHLYYYGVWLIVFLFFMVFIITLLEKRISYTAFMVIILMVLLNLLAEYRLIQGFFIHKFDTIREFLLPVRIRELTLWGHIKETMLIIFENFPAFLLTNFLVIYDGFMILLFFLLAMPVLIYHREYKKVIYLLIFFLSGVILWGVWADDVQIKTLISQFFPSIQESISGIRIRFWLVSHLFWIVFFFNILLFLVSLDSNFTRVLVQLFAVMYFLYRFVFYIPVTGTFEKWILSEGAAFWPPHLQKSSTDHFSMNYFTDIKEKYSYEQFIAPSLFKEIDEAIRQRYGLNKSSYTVLPVNLPPYILQINGFQAIGGYNSARDKISYDRISEILDTNYFSPEISGRVRSLWPIIRPDLIKNDKIYGLRLKTEKLKGFNCRFIFSPYEIIDCPDIRLFDVFKGKLWTIYVYEVI